MIATPERTIRLVSSLSDEELQTLQGWGSDIYGGDYLHLTWREKTWHFLCYEGTQLVGKASVLKHEVVVGGRAVIVGGVGGVVTVPAAQHRGHATALLRHLVGFLKNELAVPFGLGICFERLVPFYERLGWRRVSDKVYIHQASGRMECPMTTVTLACDDEPWPEGFVDIGSEPW